MAGLLDTIDRLYQQYNTLLSDYAYDETYDLSPVQMFVIQGMDSIREVIEKNRNRKLKKHKKLPNNTMIEMTDCSPIELLQHVARNKVMKVNENWEEWKAESHANVQSKQGIRNRQIRLIQTEGHFGDIKENDHFRRFHHRSMEKVYQEFMLYGIGRNINKYHRFLTGKIKEYKGKPDSDIA